MIHLSKFNLVEFSARHAENLVNDKLRAQRVEKLAQRRINERNEKLKNAQSNHFDLKLNPFFSRPLRSKPKQSASEQAELRNSSPARLDNIDQSQEDLTAYTFINTNPTESPRAVKKVTKKPKKLRYFTGNDDDDESGSPTSTVIETFSPLNISQPSIMSGLTRPITTATDATVIKSIDTLKLIFPSDHQTKYEYLFIVDKIADIYIQLVAISGYKTMTSRQFRNFAK